MNKIKKLSETSINRIAAGEVVERPSAVIKELVENSIDSGAKNISIKIDAAGKNLISISDDGCGMEKDELLLALERHTTSKLKDEDLTNIIYFGFRGEALPSISSVSNMTITSKVRGSENANRVISSGGTILEILEIDSQPGTKIDVKDLFFVTPARLKFLKADRTEQSACLDIIKRMSIAHPDVNFKFISDDKIIYKTSPDNNLEARISDVFGDEFIKNASTVYLQRENYIFKGYTSIPTYNKASSLDQFLYVNKRPVKDKLLNIALKVAYQDYLSRDRHPISVIFIETDPTYVDVNVHPAKTEIRFRESNEVRGMLISSIKDALMRTSQNTSSELASKLTNMAQSYSSFPKVPTSTYGSFNEKPSEYRDYSENKNYSSSSQQKSIFEPKFASSSKFPSSIFMGSTVTQDIEDKVVNSFARVAENFQNSREDEYITSTMGAAVAQVHSTYVISETEEGIIIVDQHAAHERLIYEKLKKDFLNSPLPSQRLIIPAIIELDSEFTCDNFLSKKTELAKFGLVFQKFNEKSLLVSEVPAILEEFDLDKLIKDLSENFREIDENIALTDLIEHVTETYACHYSVRSGRKLSISEMNQLLREIESTPFSGQCNHGRPTYVKLNLSDIEKLFGRR
jgi:DNA mismatch repair protein MutL